MEKQLEGGDHPDLEQIPMADEEGEEEEEEVVAAPDGAVGGGGLHEQEHGSISPARSAGEAIVGESGFIYRLLGETLLINF